MRTLFLLRHAKSDWGTQAARDFDRPLNPRGREAAAAVGKAMRRLGIRPALVVASPAVRAAETLARVAKAHGGLPEARIEPAIYEASPVALARMVRGADDAAESLMLVGHNPGFQLLALQFAAGDAEGLREGIEAKFPTGALAEIRFAVTRWSDVADGSGQIVRVLRPRDL